MCTGCCRNYVCADFHGDSCERFAGVFDAHDKPAMQLNAIVGAADSGTSAGLRRKQEKQRPNRQCQQELHG